MCFVVGSKLPGEYDRCVWFEYYEITCPIQAAVLYDYIRGMLL
jgi:hypothetical protein